MRIGSRLAVGLLLVSSVAAPVAAQDDPIGLDRVHQLFSAKQARPAARELSMVSVDFRKELGRCHDAVIGERMMQAEPKFDALSAKIAAGGVASVAALEKEFADFDHLLAEHHQQLASEGWNKPRFTKMETVARDLGLAAQYLTRATKWEKQTLAADAQKAVDDALAVAKQLTATPGAPPANTPAVIDALGQAVRRPSRVAQGGSAP